MNTHNKLMATLLAARIEYHWNRILRGRKRASKLLNSGIPLNSHRMLRLNRRMMHHGLATMRQQSYYENRFTNRNVRTMPRT